MQPVEAFRDLFMLNPEIQNRLKSFSDPNQFIDEAVKVGQQHNLNFTAAELKDFIDNFGQTREGDSPVCIAMGKASKLPMPKTADEVIASVHNALNTGGTGVCDPW